MSVTKCLVVTHGYFGDIIFASSIAKKLKQEKQFDIVDYLIGFPQMKSLMDNNPYINNVFNSTVPGPSPVSSELQMSDYDKVIKLSPLSFVEPPPIELQKAAGVQTPDTIYEVYTDIMYNDHAAGYFNHYYKQENSKKTIAVMRNWYERSFLFTDEEYARGIDVPNLGYGGKHRDVYSIVEKLKEHFNVIFVGFDSNVSQLSTVSVTDDRPDSLLYECSVIKQCDAFIGAEGGLCNLAAGLGTKTIITGDFVHQLYGPNGVLRKIEEPKLGPKYYFTESGHVTLNPFLTDDEVAEQIIKELNNV